MKYSITALALLGTTAYVLAAGEWQQCAGSGYPPTTCDSGLVCVALNSWYSQCQKSQTTLAKTSATPSRTTTTTAKPTSTSKTTSTKTTSTKTTSTKTTSTKTTYISTTMPVTSSTKTTTSTSSVSSPTGTCPPAPSVNPYTGYDVWLSPYYAAEVDEAVKNITDATVKAKALKVKAIPTFTWFDIMAKVPVLDNYLASARAQQTSTGKKLIVQIVVYDLPDRDCHAKASNGELLIANNGEALYRQYINNIATIIAKYPDVRVVAVVEPDSLANMITNMSDPRCANAAEVYKRCTIYALKTLNFCNVWLYLDAGHAGWLGWPANLIPAAQLFAQVYSASLPNRVRGLATNVANYNALSATTPDPVTPPNPNTDELKYINALGPALVLEGFPAKFIVDQGRSGQQGIRDEWGNWCNIAGAGFGTRPTTSTGSTWIDAIVWVKPGGECDGTSNTSAVRYDSTCGLPDAKKPAPEAGQWFQAYFVDLVNFANPPL